MPEITVVKASEAPAPPRKQSKYATELLEAINGLKRDEVLRIAPDQDKSIRGTKTGIGRVTKGAGVKVETWDDGEAVYVRKAS